MRSHEFLMRSHCDRKARPPSTHSSLHVLLQAPTERFDEASYYVSAETSSLVFCNSLRDGRGRAWRALEALQAAS